MSLFEFKLPDIGEGVMEGEIVGWLVEPGQSVMEDEPMVEVMTDKATVTIGAPKTGTVQDLRAQVGDVVPVGSVIVTLDMEVSGSFAIEEGKTQKHAAPPPPALVPEPVKAIPPKPEPARAEPAATAVGDIKDSLPGSSYFASAPPPRESEAAHFDARPLATPATRKVARDLGVDLRYVRPSGSGGRITKEDVQRHATHADAATTPGAVPAASSTSAGRTRSPVREVVHEVATFEGAKRAPIRVVAPTPEQAEREDRTPFVGIRRKIAERMQTAKNTAAHFTFVEECDVGRLSEVRRRLMPHAEASGVRLSFLPFIVKAVVSALKKHPVLNSALDESTNELVTRRYYNIGIAAATERGLMVPVVRDADRKTILEIAADIERLSNAARDGSIAPADLSGSTFTITSLGKQGGLFATPVLNLPEVGILGIHQIKQKPVVRDGAIVVGEVMLVSLSFDHRIVDGHIGAAFAYDIIGVLEDPDRLLLEMV